MSILFLSLFLLLAIFLESTLIQLPLTLIVLLLFLIRLGRSWILIFALFAGILLDTLFLRPVGQSSIFFVLFLFLVLLYEQKYELRTAIFTCLMACIGAGLYLILFGSTLFFLQIAASVFLGVALFYISSRMELLWSMNKS